MIYYRYNILILLLLWLLSLVPVAAQTETQDDVWVTAQDHLSLRLGPGQHWARVAVLAPATTWRAVGRTVNSDWLQIAYTEALAADVSTEATIDGITYGWVSATYLVWSGNVLTLPVDGIATIATARRTGPLLTIDADTVVFRELGDFDHPVTHLVSEATSVEVVGRIGSTNNDYFWLQFELDGGYYWVPTWSSGVPRGTGQVLDASYLFPFGRVYNALISDSARLQQTLDVIGSRWHDLDSGYATTCNDIPMQIVLDEQLTSTTDVQLAPIMQAPVNLLDAAVGHINTAIANFEAVCAQPLDSRRASATVIAESVAAIQAATDELRFLQVLLAPIAQRNPIVRN